MIRDSSRCRAIPPLVLVAFAVAACGGKRTILRAERPPSVPTSGDVRVGDCADPTGEGVFGDRPKPQHADRDLDGDEVAEIVVADRRLCTDAGNCHWNLYRTEGECHRYIGTVSAVSIQRVKPRGEDGFFGLRAWWNLTGNRRVLMQEYRFRRGGYRLVEARLCRITKDERVLCAEPGR